MWISHRADHTHDVRRPLSITSSEQQSWNQCRLIRPNEASHISVRPTTSETQKLWKIGFLCGLTIFKTKSLKCKHDTCYPVFLVCTYLRCPASRQWHGIGLNRIFSRTRCNTIHRENWPNGSVRLVRECTFSHYDGAKHEMVKVNLSKTSEA